MPVLPSTFGARIALHDLGGAGPPLLLCHATGMHGLVWRPLARHLADRFACWSIDFRGHGDGEVPADHELDWHRFADDVLTAVDAMGAEHLVAIGHSKGGAALLMAELERPGTFRAIYAYEPIVMPVEPAPPPRDDHPLALGALRRREVFASREEAYANYAAKPPLDSLDSEVLRAYVDHGLTDLDDGTVRLKCRGEVEAAVYRMGASHGTYSRLGDVTCPVRVASGASSTSITPAIAELQVDRLAYGTLEIFDHLGHFGPLEDPAAVAHAAAAFLIPFCA